MSRRTGGLEGNMEAGNGHTEVSRRTGGLEVDQGLVVLIAPVSRRTGGLEVLGSALKDQGM